MAFRIKIKAKFIIVTVLIHIVLTLLIFQFLKENKYIFLLSEVLIAISFIVSIQIFHSFLKPLNLISSGIESIKERDFNVKFLKVGQREMDQLIEVYSWMIDQLKNERIKQKEKHFFLEQLIEASPSGIVVFDAEMKIKLCNKSAEDVLGLEKSALQGRDLNEVNADFAKELDKLKIGKQTIRLSGNHIYSCYKGDFMDKGAKNHFILIEELTSEIHKSEKLAYGKVIRMMSHEINNTIGAINSILNSCLTYKDQLSTSDREDYENALETSIRRNDHLSQFMSNFAEVVKVPEPRKTPTNVNEMVQSVYGVIQREVSNKIIVVWELSEEPLFVTLDVQQIEQVLLNIFKNAVESIEVNGEIKVTTNKKENSIIIRDNGVGISKSNESKIFTPFYSSKEDGQGIGLTIIKEILVNHKFDFSLKTKGDFTDFKIKF